MRKLLGLAENAMVVHTGFCLQCRFQLAQVDLTKFFMAGVTRKLLTHVPVKTISEWMILLARRLELVDLE